MSKSVVVSNLHDRAKLSRKKYQNTKRPTVTEQIQWSYMSSNATTFLLKDHKLFAEGDRYSYYSQSKHFTQINRQELVVIRSSLSEKSNLHT